MTESITELTATRLLPELADGPLRWLRSSILGRLKSLRGELIVTDPDGRYSLGQANGRPPLNLQIHDRAFYAYTALGGDVGVGQAYILNLWTVDDLVGLARLFSDNRDQLLNLNGLLGLLRMPLYRLMEHRRRNSLHGSRRNIAAHYDLGNDLFALFLDPTMTYSAAVFPRQDSSLEEAQRHKYDLICRKLELKAGDELVEIGTGWGGFALHAAGEYGAQVTTTTISKNQHDWAEQRIEEAGLGGQVRLLQSDYRELRGEYDKLVSIEMIEAVGYRYLPGFMQTCDRLLKPDGQALIQAITIQDQMFDSMRNSTDYIREFIFPGGLLPSVAELTRITSQQTGLRLFALDDYARDYARTLAIWRERFLKQRAQVLRLGYDEAFVRMWDYYLASCEGAFAEQIIGVAHLLYVKDRCQREPVSRLDGVPA